MWRDIRILHKHGKQFIPDLGKVVLPEIFRGRPVVAGGRGQEAGGGEQEAGGGEQEAGSRGQEAGGRMAEFCPVGAISASPQLSIDLGKCVFCRECEFAFPDMVRFTNDYRMATNTREGLMVYAGEDKPIVLDPSKIRKEIRRVFKGSLRLRQVSTAGDNSNEMELNAAGNVNFDMGRFGIEFVASPRHADGIVITGPISENMTEALQITWEAVPSPKIIILAGTDAISGGLFAESRAIDRSFLGKYPVDLFIPGNPVHPLTFIHGILDLLGRK
jgi:Ni,Fe-hydrogenase III small subunit